MRVRPFHAFLLFLSLLLGQWTAIAHSAEHKQLLGDSHVCKTCLQYQNLGSPTPVSASPAITHFVPPETPVVTPALLATISHRTSYQSRAPPSLV